MKVLYDGSICLNSYAGGVSRYFNNLIERLPNDFDPTLTLCTREHLLDPYHPHLKTYYFQRYGFRPGRIAYWLEKKYFNAVMAFNQFEVIHPTYYHLLTRRPMSDCRVPIVLTVWDMIHEHFADQIDIYGLNAEAKRQAITAAQAIICISENTKNDLLERYPSVADRTWVTPLAADIDISMAHGPEPVPERPYLLYVGKRGTYKNFSILLDAFARIVSCYPDLILCLVGSLLESEEVKHIIDLGLHERVICLGYLPDQHLAKLYRCSLAFVYPSLYEGFGIPLLEAMACGTPVIASEVSSLPEVVGEAGLLFDPTSIDDLIDRIKFLIDNSTARDQLIVKGFEQAKQFSWEKTTKQTVDIYEQVGSN